VVKLNEWCIRPEARRQRRPCLGASTPPQLHNIPDSIPDLTISKARVQSGSVSICRQRESTVAYLQTNILRFVEHVWYMRFVVLS
jgi:hypothetical protein